MKCGDIKKKIEHATVALATVTKKGEPHNVILEVNSIKEGKVVITDNYMKTTAENIKNNPCVQLVFWEGGHGWRVCGKAKYYDSGKWLKYVKSLKENKEHPSKGAVVIDIGYICQLG